MFICDSIVGDFLAKLAWPNNVDYVRERVATVSIEIVLVTFLAKDFEDYFVGVLEILWKLVSGHLGCASVCKLFVDVNDTSAVAAAGYLCIHITFRIT